MPGRAHGGEARPRRARTRDHGACRLSAAHPLREQLRMHLAVALYRAGRQTEALDVLRDAQRVLRDELGLDASDALRSLERAILRHDPELAPPPQVASPSVRLPAVTTPLIGRERELADLRALVQRPDVRLLSLVGAGGTGKTRVALALATDCHGLFADGIALVELAPLSAPELVLPAIAHALGVGESQDESLEAHRALGGRPRALARARQLRARRGREHVAPPPARCGAAADHRRDEPASAPRLGRARLSGPASRRGRCGRPLPRACPSRGRFARADTGCHRRHSGDLRAPRRAAAGDRARRSPPRLLTPRQLLERLGSGWRC